MREFWKELKGRIIGGLIVSVFSGLILALLLSQQFRELAIKDLEKIRTEVSIPIYWLLIIFATGVIVPFLLIWKTNKKSLACYRMDEVYGLVWEWKTFDFDSSLKPLCPKCLAELPIGDYRQKVYKCVSCGFMKEYDYAHDNVFNLVRIEIEKRKRTREWKKADSRIKAIKKNIMTH